MQIVRARKTESDVTLLNEKYSSLGLKLNEKETHLLAVSSNREQAKTWIKARDGTLINSSESMKPNSQTVKCK